MTVDEKFSLKNIDRTDGVNYDYISATESAYIRDIPRKKMPVYSGVIKYFPNAIKYVSMVSQAGNDQHHPDKPLHWDKDKSSDHTDALARHLIDHSYEPMDDDGMLHLGKVAWRALAALEMYIEDEGEYI